MEAGQDADGPAGHGQSVVQRPPPSLFIRWVDKFAINVAQCDVDVDLKMILGYRLYDANQIELFIT